MRLAIMQPYLFPYIGYFQLIESVDKFVVYDDVNFIKQGWINRNNILLNGKAFMFTVPLLNASSFSLIHETQISQKVPWADKLLKTLEQAYRKAPYFHEIIGLIESVLRSEHDSISLLAANSLRSVCSYLDIHTEIVNGSSGYNNRELSGQGRVLDICRQEGATEYHNTPGGKALYSKQEFAAQGINLHFVMPRPVVYAQFREPFVPWLSIIDVLMFNEPAAVKQLVQSYILE